MSARARHIGAATVPFFQLSPPHCVQLWEERGATLLVVVVATASLAFVATSPLAARQSRGASGAGEL